MKVLRSLLVILVFGFVGFVVTVIASMTKSAEFYVWVIPVITIGLILIMNLVIFGKTKAKYFKKGVISFLALSIVTVVAFESYQAYVRSLEVVSTQDVDLWEYQPFSEGTKVAILEEPSAFKIHDNLPLLDGATALYPVFSAFAQAVYPEKEYRLYDSEVVSSQTGGSFERLLKGEVDIIFIAHPSEKQMREAERLGIELKLTPIGREAFVFFVHDNNTVDNLSVEQIQGIYSGKITNWKEVGGKDEELRAFQRPEGSGSQSALMSIMGDVPLMDPPSEDIVSAMGGIITEVTNYQNRTNAIGYSFRHFSQNMVDNGKIKHIAVEGIQPTKENIQNETYPLVDSFYAITAGSENPHVEALIAWILSEQGQELVEASGYVPLGRS